MGLNEQKEYFNKLHFDPISEKREQYVKGNLFNIGDNIVVVGSDEVGSITSLGSNYVIIESNGKLLRKWIDDIELLEKIQKENAIDVAKTKINREKKLDKIKHAGMLHRATIRKIRNRSKANA